MKILLVQTGFLGDMVLSTALIAAIKRLYPQSELWAMTTPLARELLVRDPLLAGVLTFEKRKGESGILGLWRKAKELRDMGFDRAYSAHRSFRTALVLWLSRIPCRTGFADADLSWLYHRSARVAPQLHDVQRRLQLLSGEASLESLPQDMRLFAPAGEECSAEVQGFLEVRSPYVVLVPGSVWATKRWHAKGFAEAGRALADKGYRLLLLGSKEEASLCEEVGRGGACVNFAGRSTLAEFMFLIKHAALLLCNDSMALHVASAFKVPTVAVFCATSPTFGFGPWRNQAIVVEKKGLSCKPCRPHGGMRCPLGTDACMREVSIEEVVTAALQLLGERT